MSDNNAAIDAIKRAGELFLQYSNGRGRDQKALVQQFKGAGSPLLESADKIPVLSYALLGDRLDNPLQSHALAQYLYLRKMPQDGGKRVMRRHSGAGKRDQGGL